MLQVIFSFNFISVCLCSLHRYCNAAAVGEAELDINRILGRKVNNLSKNKYKFVSNSTSSQRKSSRRTALPRKSQCVVTLLFCQYSSQLFRINMYILVTMIMIFWCI